jgi:predicted N-formylglutamate amidohydrolase
VTLHSNPTDKETRQCLPIELINADAVSPVLVVCEHASNFIPAAFHNLGLSRQALASHIAWDPGALEVARFLGDVLKAKVLASPVSRLVYDCNRPPENPDSIPARSEQYDIPGNCGLAAADRAARVRTYYKPFHDRLAREIATDPRPLALVTVHSFSPVYCGQVRKVEIGVIHDTDQRLADELLAVLASNSPMRIARNDPYGPADGVDPYPAYARHWQRPAERHAGNPQ